MNLSTDKPVSEVMKENFISILLKNGITDEVEDVTITEPLELQGEHMATATVYLTVKFKDLRKKHKNLFMKKLADNPLQTKIGKQMKLMEKEASFFNEFLPFANQFCKERAGLDHFLNFFPKCLYGDEDMLVLDNIVLNGNFAMIPKEERQDFEETLIVLDHLAKFHATTYAMIHTMGKLEFKKKWELNTFESLTRENNEFVDRMFEKAIETLVHILKTQGDTLVGSDVTIEKLQSYSPHATTLMLKLYAEGAEETFLSLNHGDCWNNNMLFQKDSKTGKVTDHIFVDLQLTRLGPPTLDLGYYLFTSVKQKVRQERFQELMRHYFGVYKATVELFNLTCPVTFEEFLKSYQTNCSVGFLINLCMLAAMGAMKDYDFNTKEEQSVEDASKAFAQLKMRWIDKNPGRVRDIAEELVLIVEEYEAIKTSSF